MEGAQVTVGGSEAKNVSQDGYKSYTGDSDDTTLEFCEKNFDKLKAKDDTNGFDAPATKWTYDGDEIGTYDKDADATLVVADAEKSLETLITDGDYMDISSKDIDADAKVFFNGLDLGKYRAVKGDDDLAGKGDIIDVYENDDNDVETIVIRSYTLSLIHISSSPGPAGPIPPSRKTAMPAGTMWVPPPEKPCPYIQPAPAASGSMTPRARW